LDFTVAAGSNYLLQVTSDLTPPIRWANVAIQAAGGASNNNWSFVATNDTLYPHRYYRLTAYP